MPFVYLDDQFPDHPKVIRAGADAAWLFVCGLAYSRRYGTGGAIPTAQVSKLTTLRNPLKLAGRLCAERLWEVIRDGFQIHDYDDWNRTADSRSEAGRKAAHARWHGKSDAVRNANASNPHVPQDALSLSPNPRPKDFGSELPDVESVSNHPRDDVHETPSTQPNPEDLVADLAQIKAMP